MANTKIIKTGNKRQKFTKKACGSVTEMRKKAEAARKRGSLARVEKNTTGSGACLWTGGKRKKKSTSSTTKKRKTTRKKSTKRKTTAKRKPAKRKRRTSSSSSRDFLSLRG